MKLLKRNKAKSLRARRPVDTSSRPITSSYSYRTSRSDEADNVGRDTSRQDSPKRADKGPRRFLLEKFGLLILISVLLICALNLLLVAPNVKVVNLGDEISSGTVHSEDQYAAYANQLIKKSRFNSNKITINTGSISADLTKKYPELSSANLSLPLFGKRPTLYIDTSNQALILLAPQGTYLINERGKAIANVENAQAAAGSNLPIVNDQSGLATSVNQQVLSSKNVIFIETVYKQLKAKGYNPNVMTLPPGTSELDVSLEGQPYIVKFNLRSNSGRQQVGTFLATINKLKSQNITPTQYVDVRVDGRAYYL